jgi:hypothetical protein
MFPESDGPLATLQQPIQQPRRHDGGFAGVGMRILAICDQSIGEVGHPRGEVGVQIHHAAYRQLCRARQLTNSVE